ncbi:MAG: hypothetical protein ABW141_20135 [Candidatus Thiodiazotropha endolucinida]
MIAAYPSIYQEFVGGELWPAINGLPLLVDESDSLTPSSLSIQWAMNELVAKRPDLDGEFLPIRILDDRALCFRRDSADRLYELSLSGDSGPVNLNLTFKEYLAKFEKTKAYAFGQLKHIENKFFPDNEHATRKEFDRRNIRGTPRKKPDEWKLIRSCIHDRVVSILAYKVNRRAAALEVDVFLASDHPDYERWNSIKASITLLFSEAHKFGIPPRILFTKGKKRSKIPNHIIACIHSLGRPSPKKSDVLEPSDTIELLIRLLGIPENVMGQIRSDQQISLGGLCYLVANRIWSPISIAFTIATVADYRRLLIGESVIEENPILFLEYINRACNAISVDFFLEKLRHDPKRISHDGTGSTSVDFSVTATGTIRILLSDPCEIPWLLRDSGASKPFNIDPVKTISIPDYP